MDECNYYLIAITIDMIIVNTIVMLCIIRLN